MDIKIIKTESDYNKALDELERLMTLQPPADSEESNKLEILALLIEKYEEEHYHFDVPEPIDAIKLVMEQRKLSNADMAKYIGSKSKVSEVLSGNRQLSKRMIRALHNGLGIPADILIKESKPIQYEDEELEWDKFPLAELRKKKWITGFDGSLAELKEYAEEYLQPMINNLKENCLSPALPRTSASKYRGGKDIDQYALVAWQAKIIELVKDNQFEYSYSKNIGLNFLKRVAQLSVLDNGPLCAKELLNKNGIYLIILPHLNKTYLDGAAMLLKDGSPVIGLTLRQDRLDNFWFSLLHELSHVAKHLDKTNSSFFDDFDQIKAKNPDEIEADKMASEALLPPSQWNRQKSIEMETAKIRSIKQLASEKNIHVSILAGRIQYDTDNYGRFQMLLGRGIPSELFKTESN